jgi:hypothetical protein
MQIIGLCRFSYPALGGFQITHDSIEDRIAYLYSDHRLTERFRLFETVALPSLRAQTDPDFTLIIVVGDQFPTRHKSHLEALIADVPQAVLHQEPPRRHREAMKEILNDARLNPGKACLQFRFDDDDAVGIDFIEKLRRTVKDCTGLLEQNKTVAFDWNRGYLAEFSAEGISACQVFRPLFVAALGMYVKGNCPLTIMNFAHEKMAQFMPVISLSDPDMWVRSHSDYNDSRQNAARSAPVLPLTADQETLFKDRFAIDADHVKRVFSTG